MTATTYYSFPLIAEAQSNKYLTHNDAISQIDLVLFGLVGAPTTPGIVQSSGLAFGVVTIDTSLTYASTTLSLNLGHSNAWTKSQRVTPVTLTDAATIATDLSLSNNFVVTLGGNRTLGNPTNINAGQAGIIVVKQDGTGSRTLAYASDWKFAGGTAPILTTAAGAIDVLSYYVVDSTHILVSSALNFS